MTALTTYDVGGFAALALLWLALLGLVALGAWLTVQANRDAASARDFQRRQHALWRAHLNVTGRGMPPSPGAHQLRGEHRSSTPAG